MTDEERLKLENALKEIDIQDQKNKNLINLIQKTDVKELENERYNNLSAAEKKLLK